VNLVAALIVAATFAVLASLLLVRARVPDRWAPVTALARAAVQLAALVLVLHWIFADIGWVFAWLAVMYVVAVASSARRVGFSRERLLVVGASIGLAASLTIGAVFASGAFAMTPQYLLAVGGITMGGVMNIASLAIRRLREQLVDHRDEVEGLLALGATPREATRRFRSAAVANALFPNLDSTRVTGLVTLPGSFVGAIFGGADPLEAGVFQLVVLACIILGGAIAALTATTLLGSPKTLPLA